MADASMSMRHPASRTRVERPRSTFIVEAMLLLVCLLIVLAASMSLFAYAWQEGGRAADEQQAITLAQNTAERFAADPAAIEPVEEVDGFQVRAQVDWQPQASGQMACAIISVVRDGGTESLFELSTACYVPDAGEEVRS